MPSASLRAMSRPTRAATPANPTKSPVSRRASKWSATPSARYATAPMRGTVAISRPASELEMRCSAWASSSHGTHSSTAVYRSTHGQLRSMRRSSPLRSANGRSRSAAGAVRSRTSAAGGSSRTAMRMNRYGMPQITHSAMNSSQPLRDTRGILPSTSPSSYRERPPW